MVKGSGTEDENENKRGVKELCDSSDSNDTQSRS